MLRLLLFLTLFLTLFCSQSDARHRSVPIAFTGGGGGQKFAGPFANWLNVKATCSATGNGSTNDVVAIQSCINDLSSSAPVIWFPSGTYLINPPATTIATTAASPVSSIIVASGTNIVAGMQIVSAGIPAGDAVDATYTPGSTTVPLTVATTGTVTSGNSVTFSLGLNGKQFVSLIGASKETASLVWGGPSGGTMLAINGTEYARIDRLTFNGSSSAGIIVNDNWDNRANYSSTGTEYTDDTFENATVGFNCGSGGFQCSEISMIRDQFLNMTGSGVQTANFNALDVWVWNSFFQSNGVGLGNNYGPYCTFSGGTSLGEGAGNLHAFSDVFLGSVYSDFCNQNTGLFTLAFNYSNNAQQFMESMGNFNANSISAIDNTVLNTSTNFESSLETNLGTGVFVGNTIENTSGLDSVIKVAEGGTSNGLFYSNSYASPCSGGSCSLSWAPQSLVSGATCVSNGEYAFSDGPCYEINDRIIAPASINQSQPTLPGTPPLVTGTIYEVTPGGTGTGSITGAIAAANASCSNAVVHLQSGAYTLSSTLTVSANCTVQIVGDGYYATVGWSGGASPMIDCLSPCKAVFDNFALNGNGAASAGIKIENADQAQGRVFIEQPLLTFNSNSNLLVNGLNSALVEVHDIQETTSNGVGINVVGGTSVTTAATNVFAGLTYGDCTSFKLSNQGNLLVDQYWHDNGGNAGCSSFTLGTISGSGNLTLAGMESSLPSPSTTELSFSSFTGTAALLDIIANGSNTSNINLTGSGGTVLADGLVGLATSFWNDTTTTGSSALLNPQLWNGSAYANLAAACRSGGATATCPPSYIPAALNQIVNTKPTTFLTALPSGITDVFIDRVYVTSAGIGIDIE